MTLFVENIASLEKGMTLFVENIASLEKMTDDVL
jgi:hypothetical protein